MAWLMTTSVRTSLSALRSLSRLPRLPVAHAEAVAHFSSKSASTPVRRSVLFVPAKEKMLRKAQAGFGADAIILDLEDAVAASEKDNARIILKSVLKENQSNWGGAEVIVRANGLETPYVASCGIRWALHTVITLQMGPKRPGCIGRHSGHCVIHAPQDRMH